MANIAVSAPADDAGQNKKEQPEQGGSTVPASQGLNSKSEAKGSPKPNGSIRTPSRATYNPETDCKEKPAHKNSGQAENSPELPSSKPGSMNLEKFRVNESDYAEHAGGKKLLTTVPVRKPSKESFFRTHPSPDFRFPAKVIELKEQGETYLVDRALWPELAGESTLVSKVLVPALTRQQAYVLWGIRLPGADGKIDDWNRSALEAAEIAMKKWIRLSPNRSLGAYEIIVGPDPQADATWPDYSFQLVLEIAFKGKIIDSVDHPVIRQLRGLS